MVVQQYEYCLLKWWWVQIGPQDRGVDVTWFTEQGLKSERIFESKGGRIAEVREDLPKFREIIGSTIAQLGLEGWEAVQGEPSAAYWRRPGAGKIFFKRPTTSSFR